MNPDKSTDPSAAENGSGLGHLVDELTHRLQAGEAIDLEEWLAAHPNEAEGLRAILPALEAMAELGLSLGREASQPPHLEHRGRSCPHLIGDYRILREIGRGGMGVVYEAEQRSLSRRVALKVLPLAAALDARQLQRFQLEARAAACLHHQNIVPVFAIGTDDGVPYYAMQYIEGRTLADLFRELRRMEGLDVVVSSPDRPTAHPVLDRSTTTLARSLLLGTAPELDERIVEGGATTKPIRTAPAEIGVQPAQQEAGVTPRTPSSSALTASTRTRSYAETVARLGLQAAEALDHAHARGILHRDIKPANLMLDADGRLWVTDFGLAQVQGDHRLTRTGDLLGTLRYMSPEQVQGKRVVIDGRTDLYSLGVTLYELLTLHPAFTGRDRVEILRRIAGDEPVPIRKRNAAVPRDLATVVQKAMAKEPSERYATVQEFAQDLRRVLESRPIAAVRPSLWQRTQKWMKRHRAEAAAAIVMFVAGVLSLAGWAWDRSARLSQLGYKVERLLGEARAALQASDPAVALRHLAEARGHLAQARYGDGPLTRELSTLMQSASARSAAEDQFRHFQQLRLEVHASMYHLGADAQRHALDQGRAALDLYQAMRDGPWEPPQLFRDLPASSQAEVREAVLELLFLTARIETKTTYSAKDRGEAHHRTLTALERIEQMQGPGAATASWMAWTWDALGQPDRARQESRRANGLAVRTALDELMLAELKATQGQPNDALAGYRRALRLRPNHLPSLLGEARILFELKKYEAAETLLTGIIALRPDDPFAYSIRGQTRERLGNYDAALDDFRKLAEINPHDYTAYYNQGALLNMCGQHERAVAMFDKALDENPGSFSSHLHRGIAYSELGRDAEAYADFTHVIETLNRSRKEIPLERGWADHLIAAHMKRGNLSARMNRHDQALADYDAVLKIDPRYAMAYHLRAEKVMIPAGRYREAIEDFTRAIEIEPENERHWRCRANGFSRSGDNTRALDDLSRVIALKPEQPSGYLDRAAMRMQQGGRDAALEDVDRALALPDGAISKVDLYNAACVMALASDHLSKDQTLADRQNLAARHADRAVELLRRAIAKGWTDPRDLDLMRKDPDLEPIRHHPDFESLLASVQRTEATDQKQADAMNLPKPWER